MSGAAGQWLITSIFRLAMMRFQRSSTAEILAEVENFTASNVVPGENKSKRVPRPEDMGEASSISIRKRPSSSSGTLTTKLPTPDPSRLLRPSHSVQATASLPRRSSTAEILAEVENFTASDVSDVVPGKKRFRYTAKRAPRPEDMGEFPEASII